MTTTSERLAAVRQWLTATLARLQEPVAGLREFAHLDTMLAGLFAHARAVGVPVRTARQHLAEAAVHAGASVAPAAVGAPIKRGSAV